MHCPKAGLTAWCAGIGLKPEHFREVPGHAPGHRLFLKLARRFEADFEPDSADGAWMPAWVLVDRPLLADVLSAAEVPPQNDPAQALRVVMGLLRLERAGRHHDVIDYRKRLRDLSGKLFAAYMATRCAPPAASCRITAVQPA